MCRHIHCSKIVVVWGRDHSSQQHWQDASDGASLRSLGTATAASPLILLFWLWWSTESSYLPGQDVAVVSSALCGFGLVLYTGGPVLTKERRRGEERREK